MTAATSSTGALTEIDCVEESAMSGRLVGHEAVPSPGNGERRTGVAEVAHVDALGGGDPARAITQPTSYEPHSQSTDLGDPTVEHLDAVSGELRPQPRCVDVAVRAPGRCRQRGEDVAVVGTDDLEQHLLRIGAQLGGRLG